MRRFAYGLLLGLLLGNVMGGYVIARWIADTEYCGGFFSERNYIRCGPLKSFL